MLFREKFLSNNNLFTGITMLPIEVWIPFFVIILGLLVLLFSMEHIAPKKPSKIKGETYWSGEKPENVSNLVRITYWKFLLFFSILEMVPVLLALTLMSGAVTALLALYLVVVAVASFIMVLG
jgi:NADH:ubiquinone oxidoreductase subunit 3 (subunit A)